MFFFHERGEKKKMCFPLRDQTLAVWCLTTEPARANDEQMVSEPLLILNIASSKNPVTIEPLLFLWRIKRAFEKDVFFACHWLETKDSKICFSFFHELKTYHLSNSVNFLSRNLYFTNYYKARIFILSQKVNNLSKFRFCKIERHFLIVYKKKNSLKLGNKFICESGSPETLTLKFPIGTFSP